MQAALITAYKDVEYLKWLIGYLSGFMKVFVHIDKKSNIRTEDISGLRCQVLKKYRIGWGGYEHVLAVVALMRLAAEDPEVDYCHVISGQDLPVRSADWFCRELNVDRDYMTCWSPDDQRFPRDWIRYYFPTTFFGIDRKTRFGAFVHGHLLSWQRRLRIHRSGLGEYKTVYKGLVYVSLRLSSMRQVLRCFDASWRFRMALRWCSIPEEFFFQTILMNSPLAAGIVRNDLRYSDWTFRNGSSPAYLDASDSTAIRAGDFMFARKVDSRVSVPLIERIKRERLGV